MLYDTVYINDNVIITNGKLYREKKFELRKQKTAFTVPFRKKIQFQNKLQKMVPMTLF